MAFSPENHRNNDHIESKKSPGEQLKLKLWEVQDKEVRGWGELFQNVKSFRVPDWAKFIGAGVGAGLLIGTAWYLKKGQKVADWSEGLGWKLAKLVKDGLKELRKK